MATVSGIGPFRAAARKNQQNEHRSRSDHVDLI